MDADWDRLRAGAFWRWLFKGEASFEDERSFTLELIIASGDGLNVEVAEGTSVTLVDRREGTELGWLDDAHFHPGAQVQWHLDGRRRWCLRQATDDLSVRPLYSVRVEENPDFPAWLSELGR
jgi:hypothetical protein